MTISLPAIIIGGPPHSGKSVLSYSLTKALKARRVEHYLLRACPDGEGNWSHEAASTTVERIREKGTFNDHFVEALCQDLAKRHLPLLVDVGGKLTVEQDAILRFGTAAILLVADRDAAVAAAWRQRYAAHGLPLLADLASTLEGTPLLAATAPLVRGRLTALERGTTAHGPLFDALCDHLAIALSVPDAQLRQRHAELAPHPWLELDRIDAWRRPQPQRDDWVPAEVPLLLQQSAPQRPVALYGRAPSWLYAALANHAYPAAVAVFDARMGWVPAPAPARIPSWERQPVCWQVVPRPTHQRLELKIEQAYLAYETIGQISPPALDPCQGVVLSGRFPNWLLIATSFFYRAHPWVAVYQPQLNGYAVIVHSRSAGHPIGTTVWSPNP